jgi:hypothetical protein
MIEKRGFELNMPMGTMPPEKGITIGQDDEHRTVLLYGPEEEQRALFQGCGKKRRNNTFLGHS